MYVPPFMHASRWGLMRTEVDLSSASLDLGIAKMEYSSEKKMAKEHKEKVINQFQLQVPRLYHLLKQLPRVHTKWL